MERETDILDTIDGMGLQERGTLRSWMAVNHDAFAKRLERFKPDWSALAAVFAKAGLTDRRGNPPTAEATRKTWFGVHRTAVGKPAASPPAATEHKAVVSPHRRPEPRVPLPTDIPDYGADDPFPGIGFASDWKPKDTN